MVQKIPSITQCISSLLTDVIKDKDKARDRFLQEWEKKEDDDHRMGSQNI